MSPVPGSMDGNSPQQQVPHRPTTSHLPGPFPFSTTASSYMDSFRSGGNGDLLHSVGQSILWPPTFTDVSCPRDPRRSILAHRQLHRTSTTPWFSYKTNGMAQTVEKDRSMVLIQGLAVLPAIIKDSLTPRCYKRQGESTL